MTPQPASTTQPRTAQPAPTTLAGVFARQQAISGQYLYQIRCRSCHNEPRYHLAMIKLHWAGRPLADLFRFVEREMPKDNPGTLTPKQTADVVAWLLQAMSLPAGRAQLPADSAVLSGIRFDTLDTRSASRVKVEL